MPAGLGFEIALPVEIIHTKRQRRKWAQLDIPLACNAVLEDDAETAEEFKVLAITSDKDDTIRNLPMQNLDPRPYPDVKEAQALTATPRQGSLDLNSTYEVSNAGSTSTSSVSSGSRASVSSSESRKSSKSTSSQHSLSTEELNTALATPLSVPIAILPQYLLKAAKTIHITEASFPHLSSNFTVTSQPYTATFASLEVTSEKDFPDSQDSVAEIPDPSLSLSEPILVVHRSRPSLAHKQLITTPADTKYTSPLLTINRRHGSLPLTHAVCDPAETRIASIHGNFSASFSGASTTMVFTNACTGQKIHLILQGSWHNRRAVIRVEETGEVVACMTSKVWTWKNAVAGRRDYEVHIRAGVDVVCVAAMVVALDDRAE